MSKRMNRESRREQIAEAALKLAAEGVSTITVERVARECEIVPSALYRHYRNKEDILDGLRDLIQKRLMENAALAVKEEKSPMSMLKNLAMRHARMLSDNPGIPRLMFSEEITGKNSTRRKSIQQMMDRFRTAVADIAERGQKSGEIRPDITPHDVVFMLLGTVIPPSFLFHVSDGGFDPLPQVERNLKLFEDAVGTAKMET